MVREHCDLAGRNKPNGTHNIIICISTFYIVIFVCLLVCLYTYFFPSLYVYIWGYVFICFFMFLYIYMRVTRKFTIFHLFLRQTNELFHRLSLRFFAHRPTQAPSNRHHNLPNQPNTIPKTGRKSHTTAMQNEKNAFSAH